MRRSTAALTATLVALAACGGAPAPQVELGPLVQLTPHVAQLDLRGRATCAIASLVALRFEEELEGWLDGGLRAGLSVTEVVEILMQTAYYAG
ncbi:hypothetical protein B4Q13_25400, partial [Lacticaseibacillus rhamnosus]